MAIQRCENTNNGSECEAYMGTMAVKKCPAGYWRNGCCQCVIPCPEGYWEEAGTFCLKSDPIRGKKYNSWNECQLDKSVPGKCELFGNFLSILNIK